MHRACSITLHASCVAIGDQAVLLRGPSGSGKSDLALRLIDQGAVLVADDLVVLSRTGAGALHAAPPPPLLGLLEVRGIGPMRLPCRPLAPLRLAVDLVPAEAIERVPLPREEAFLGCRLPLLRLDPWPASAVARLRLALTHADQLAQAHAVRAAAE